MSSGFLGYFKVLTTINATQVKSPNTGFKDLSFVLRKENGFHKCASSHSLHNLAEVFTKTHLKTSTYSETFLHFVKFYFLKQIVLWFYFLVHSWPICRKSLKIFYNTKYIFLEVAGVIIYLWRCTAEKASLYLTCVKKYHYPPIYKYVILEEEACAVAADVVCQVLTSIFSPLSVSDVANAVR